MAITTTSRVPVAITLWAGGEQFTIWKNNGKRPEQLARWTLLSARDSCR